MEIRQTLDIDFSITQELGPAFSPPPLNLSKSQSKKGKSEQQVDTIYTMRQMLEHNMVN